MANSRAALALAAAVLLSAAPAAAGDGGSEVEQVLEGRASWYGGGFHGRPTASGAPFNQHALTAAHRSLPFGTELRVTNLRNGEQVEVTVTDRGPYSRGRILDLSRGAAAELGMLERGVSRVRIEVLADDS